jgi:hypothetical protein
MRRKARRRGRASAVVRYAKWKEITRAVGAGFGRETRREAPTLGTTFSAGRGLVLANRERGTASRPSLQPTFLGRSTCIARSSAPVRCSQCQRMNDEGAHSPSGNRDHDPNRWRRDASPYSARGQIRLFQQYIRVRYRRPAPWRMLQAPVDRPASFSATPYPRTREVAIPHRARLRPTSFDLKRRARRNPVSAHHTHE